MSRQLLDTNILILHIGDIEPVEFIPGFVAVSSVTVFELLRYPGMSSEERQKIQNMIDACVEIPVNSTIARRAAELSFTRPKMKSLDVLIAATALVYHLPLVTKNTKDFKGVKGLTIHSFV